MLILLSDIKVLKPNSSKFKGATPEEASHISITMSIIPFSFKLECSNRWMMRHLFSHQSKIRLYYLISLSKDWIKRLSISLKHICILRHNKGRNICYSLVIIFDSYCFIHYLTVVGTFTNLLEH
jgi:hypothetical protein